tara:strand:- start:43831 stop:45894 length:2064 start_codon:yes stop_codon:yes gene_type:complete
MLTANIIMLYVMFQMLMNLLSSKKSNTLGCGNFGWTGDDVKKFNMDKFNILGIMNEDRGKNSCGVYVDGKLYKGDDIGVNNIALYGDMMKTLKFPSPKKFPVIMGHTRAASRGGIKSVENTHPFIFKTPAGDNFVGAHNGTLDNHTFLADRYDIEKTDDNNRLKVDSEILLEILSQTSENNKNVRVLQEYKGRAALVMFNEKEPDEMWFWRGKSKQHEYASAKAEEERPLHIYMPETGSMYWSSEIRPLEMIANKKHTDDDCKILSFKTNVLYKIKGGVISESSSIDRENNKKFATTYEYNTYINSKKKKNEKGDNKKKENITPVIRMAPSTSDRNAEMFNQNKNRLPTTDSNSLNNFEKKMCKNIFYEKIIRAGDDATINDIIYENLRYKQNNILVKDGVYIYSTQRGFIFLSDSVKVARTKIANFTLKNEKDENVYFGNQEKLTLFYMINGILLEKELDYLTTMEKGSDKFSISQLSHMSLYPVCRLITPLQLKTDKTDILLNERGYFINKIIKDASVCSMRKFSPLGSTYTYTVKNGDLEDSTFSMLPNKICSSFTVLNEGLHLESENFESNLDNAVTKYSTTGEEWDDDNEALYELYTEFNESLLTAIEAGRRITTEFEGDLDMNLALYDFVDELDINYRPIKDHIENIILESSNDSEEEEEEEDEITIKGVKSEEWEDYIGS